MVQILFAWAAINAIVSVLNVVNLRRLKKWEAELETRETNAATDLLD